MGLNTVFNKCDKFVTLKGGGLMHKIWWMSEKSGNWEPARRLAARYFFKSFLWNSNKFSTLDASTINQLPDDLHHQTPDDDLYLLQTAINTKDKLILTTEERLKEKLSARQELNIHLVDEFLQKYDC
jgi:hypothetical protein